MTGFTVELLTIFAEPNVAVATLEVKETLTATVPVPPPPELIYLLSFTFPSSPFNTLPVLLRGLKP